MAITLKDLEKKDYLKAIQYAIDGMHFQVYFENDKYGLYFYARYFFYSEMLKATTIIAGYDEGQLIGLLIAQVDGQRRCYHSFSKWLYVKLFEGIQRVFFRGSTGQYEQACQDMLHTYHKQHQTQGEIVFLAVDPCQNRKGLGILLLQEFEKTVLHKTIYLYTDHWCAYQFYDHRCFHRVQESDIVLNLQKDVTLKCMLYVKTVGDVNQ